MHWNVFMEDFNHKQIIVYDILDNARFEKEFANALEKANGRKSAFADEIRRVMMYHFWSKCEYEIVLTCWPPACGKYDFKDRKIDVFEQLSINWDQFIDYVWAHRAEFAKRPKDIIEADELNAMFDNGVDLLAEVGVDG